MSALLSTLLLALLAVFGAGAFAYGLVGLFETPRARLEPTAGRAQRQRVSDLPEFLQSALGATFIGIGRRLVQAGSAAAVEDRLRRSGWRYGSLGDYYASKIVNAILYFLIGLMCGGLLFGASIGALAGIVFAVLGYFRPDEKIAEVTRERHEGIKREMAWTLDRLATVMQTGDALGPSLSRLTDRNYDWVAGGGGGLFVAVMRDISAGLSQNRSDIGQLVDDIRLTLPPDLPEVDEFLLLVRANLEKRQPVVEQLRALGASMRDELNNKIEELAQKSELRIVMVTSGVIVPMLLIIVGGGVLPVVASILR